MIRNVPASHSALCSLALLSSLATTSSVIAGGPPIAIPYQGCGQLLPGIECATFVGNDGTSFSMPLTNGFQLGDFVYVDGDICAVNCVSFCQDGPIFLLNSIKGCSDQALFSECGTVSIIGKDPESQCLVFQSDKGGTYLPDNFGTFKIGDRVRVSSNEISTPCVTPCGEITACLGFNQIDFCGIEVNECGTLALTGTKPFECIVFQGDSGNTYGINNIGKFEVGDRVRVIGTTGAPCLETCGELAGCIEGNLIQGCDAIFDECGTVTVFGDEQQQCIGFQSDSGLDYFIDNLGSFKIGDQVRVTSNLIGDPCETLCHKFEACLHLNTIEQCGMYVDECGELIPSGSLPFFCIAFQGESGNIYGINNIGEFGIGDHVRITGTTGGICMPECGQLDACIEGNTIQACGVPFDECGTIVPGGSAPFFCLVFQASSGLKYYIDNSGPYGVGSHVRVTGVTGAGCTAPNGICGDLDGCLFGNTIAGCPDINSSGAVDVDDLLAVINAWGQCPPGTIDDCPEDFNANGVVDVDDLLIVINAWS